MHWNLNYRIMIILLLKPFIHNSKQSYKKQKYYNTIKSEMMDNDLFLSLEIASLLDKNSNKSENVVVKVWKEPQVTNKKYILTILFKEYRTTFLKLFYLRQLQHNIIYNNIHYSILS